jgi:hypothetical protein
MAYKKAENYRGKQFKGFIHFYVFDHYCLVIVIVIGTVLKIIFPPFTHPENNFFRLSLHSNTTLLLIFIHINEKRQASSGRTHKGESFLRLSRHCTASNIITDYSVTEYLTCLCSVWRVLKNIFP